MKAKFLALLQRIGHLQAQLFLALLFIFILVPYKIILRLFIRRFLPSGHWQTTEKTSLSLDDLRRTF